MVYPLYPVTDDIYSLQHFHHLYTSSLTVYDIFSILVQCTLEPNNFGRTSFKFVWKTVFKNMVYNVNTIIPSKRVNMGEGNK